MILIIVLAVTRARSTAKRHHEAQGKVIEQHTGLALVHADTSVQRMEGVFRGRPVTFETDSSAVVRAAYAGTAMGVGLAMLGGNAVTQSSNRQRRVQRVAQRMTNQAAIRVLVRMTLPADLPGAAEVAAGDGAGFTQVKPDLFVRADGGLAATATDAAAALDPVPFDRVDARGRTVELTWAPSAEEFRAHFGNPQTPEPYARGIRDLLDGLAAYADRLAGAV
jgi:hypothetical protein